jgi:hypothetical protein
LTRVGRPSLGQLDALPRTLEQPQAEKFLEAGNLPTDRTLGQRQFARRLGEALMARSRLESNKGRSAGNLPTHELIVPFSHNTMQIFRL